MYTRFFKYWWGIKGRMIFLSLAAYGWQYFNMSTKWSAYKDRQRAKYQRRWIQKFNPTSVIYTTARDTAFRPEKLSPELSERLMKRFIELDKELECGVSR